VLRRQAVHGWRLDKLQADTAATVLRSIERNPWSDFDAPLSLAMLIAGRSAGVSSRLR
jgi:hypothetical protein